MNETSELIMVARLSVPHHDKGPVALVRLVTIEGVQGGLEYSAATASALQCEVGNWKHSKLINVNRGSCADAFALF